MKKIAILQSNYIPWKGYFDIINSVDEFVIYDTAQYTRRDWRNRNIIKSCQGLKWLTIPVIVKGKYKQKINETRIANNNWAVKHLKTITHYYSATPYFSKYKTLLGETYTTAGKMVSLSEVNMLFIKLFNSLLGINTKITLSTDYLMDGTKTEKIISVCKQSGSMHYLSGPSAKGYIDEKLFIKEGIKLSWADYLDYPEYDQLNPPFEHRVSMLDLILNKGDKATNFMKSFK
jgi:hypothetical protein